ncbi:MAG: hemolysin, partial [Paludibacter sp.]|nr:hemolysin [Paludibacter sp.]
DQLITPLKTIHVSPKTRALAKKLFVEKDSSGNYKALQKAVREEGVTIPSMFHAYIGLTDTMRVFGSIFDPDFGSVYETGIMITMADLLETKQRRYILPYIEYMKKVIEERKKAKLEAKEKKHDHKLARKAKRKTKDKEGK